MGIFNRLRAIKKTEITPKADDVALSPKFQQWAKLGVSEVRFTHGAPDCCQISLDSDGKIFPLRQAPPIPLPRCDAAHCWCMFHPQIPGLDD